MNIVTILKANALDLSLHNQAISKLYSCFDYSMTRYEMVRSTDQFNTILENDCYVSVQFQGVAYIIFFCSLDVNGSNKRMNILISKKELKQHEDQSKINEIKMYSIYLPFVNDKYYENGAILDGKLIKTDSTNKINHTFLFHELYYSEYIDMDLQQKHEIIRREFKPKFEKLNLDFKLIRLYQISELENLLFDRLCACKHVPIGLMFLFKRTRSYYVWTNEHEMDLLKKGKQLPNTKVYDNTIEEFKMSSTNITDVFRLYDLNDNTYIGLAGIISMKTSRFFRKLSEKTNTFKVRCIKLRKFKKWIPIVDDCYDYNLYD